MQAFSYRGPDDPSEEALHYVVQTAAAKQQSKDKHQIPSLPSGSLITGLAAAAIQHAEVITVTPCSLLNSFDTPFMMPAIKLQALIGRLAELYVVLA